MVRSSAYVQRHAMGSAAFRCILHLTRAGDSGSTPLLAFVAATPIAGEENHRGSGLGEAFATTGAAASGLVAETTIAALELGVAVDISALEDLARSSTDLARRAASSVAAVAPPLDMRHLVLAGVLFLHSLARAVFRAFVREPAPPIRAQVTVSVTLLRGGEADRPALQRPACFQGPSGPSAGSSCSVSAARVASAVSSSLLNWRARCT